MFITFAQRSLQGCLKICKFTVNFKNNLIWTKPSYRFWEKHNILELLKTIVSPIHQYCFKSIIFWNNLDVHLLNHPAKKYSIVSVLGGDVVFFGTILNWILAQLNMHPKDHPASFLMHREDVKQMRGVPHAHGFRAYSINKDGSTLLTIMT